MLICQGVFGEDVPKIDSCFSSGWKPAAGHPDDFSPVLGQMASKTSLIRSKKIDICTKLNLGHFRIHDFLI